MQLSFFNLDDPLLENIKDEILHIDIDTLTPVEALMKLNEIKRMLILIKGFGIPRNILNLHPQSQGCMFIKRLRK